MFRVSSLAAGCVLVGALSRVEVYNDCSDDPRVPFMVVGNEGSKSKTEENAEYMCPQTKALAPGEHVTFTAPSEGMPSMRFWGLAGCNNVTGLCTWGQDVVGDVGFPKIAPKYAVWGYGTQPPAYSYFEVSFGCNETDTTKCRDNPSGDYCGEKITDQDWFDVSAVDGLTPLRVEVHSEGTCTAPPVLSTLNTATGKPFRTEELCYFNWYLPKADNSTPAVVKNVDTRVVDIDGNVLGCASPCQRLTQEHQEWFVDGQPNMKEPVVDGVVVPSLPVKSDSAAARYYCCQGVAVDSDACVQGVPFKGSNGKEEHITMFQSTVSPYYELSSQNVYSEPYSDNEKATKDKVNFNCKTGSLVFKVLLQCPLAETYPQATPPPGAMLSVTYAKQRQYETENHPTCVFDLTAGAPDKDNGMCPSSVPCQDCSAYSVDSDIRMKGSQRVVTCVCLPNVKVALPPPTPGEKAWADPQACLRPVSTPAPAVCPKYRCEDKQCKRDDSGDLTEHQCSSTCGVDPVYTCSGSPEFQCAQVPAGTVGSTSLFVCQSECRSGTGSPTPSPPPPAPVYKCDRTSANPSEWACKEVRVGTAGSSSLLVCQKDCGEALTEPEPTTLAPPTTQPCEDKTWFCRGKQHWCKRYPEVMAGFCPLSCGICTPPPAECLDKEDYCGWVSRFMCRVSSTLRVQCPATCGSCQELPRTRLM